MSLNLPSLLNPEQYKAASALEGPVLIIAGAGSGKTRMLTYRIANMLDKGIKEENILALTFTNKAAREMQERIREITGRKCEKLVATTFHSFGMGILKQYIQYLGYHNDFTIYDENDNISLLKQCIRELEISEEKLNYRILLHDLSDIKTERVKGVNPNSEMGRIYKEWTTSQKAYNVVDFDDLIILPIKLFETKDFILSAVQDRYRYILVDEFQDTSLKQYQLVRMIAEKYRNLCVVGDDDQSIYSWRGANYRNFQCFEKDFPERKEFKLEKNYRSSKNILSAANGIIRNNKCRKDKTLYTDGDNGAMIIIRRHEDEEEQCEEIVRSIRRDMRKYKHDYRDFAVLVRTNSQIRALEDVFMMENVPYTISGGSSFFDRREVRDIISYIKALINENDDASFLRIVNVPPRGIGRTTVERLRRYADNNNLSLQKALCPYSSSNDTKAREKRVLESFIGLWNSWKSLIDKPCTLINKIMEDGGYRNMLITEESEKSYLFKMRGIQFLSDRISAFLRKNPDFSVRDYIRAVTLASDDEKENESKVNIMTIHASKGLEFRTVHISGCDSKHIPSEKALEENPDNIEEERRLFYVAITRAREKLVLHYSDCCKNSKNEDIMVLPSVFLKEIDTALTVNEEIAPEEAKAEGLRNMEELLLKMKSKLANK